MEPEVQSVRLPAWRFALRVLLIAAELILVFLLGSGGTRFFYQGF